MKIVFFGNKGRGISCLSALHLAKHEIPLVIGHPEHVKTCSNSGSFSEHAASLGYTIEQPENVNDAAFLDKLRAIQPDLFILCGYGKILKSKLLEIPKLGSLNCHAGKLPQFRGSSPINWSLIQGESSIGLSVILLDKGIDTGDIVAEDSLPVAEQDTANTLQEKADQLFPALISKALNNIEQDALSPLKQNEDNACYYCLRSPQDGLILWEQMTAREVVQLVRALSHPYPNAFSFFGKYKILIEQAEIVTPKKISVPGKIVKKMAHGFEVMCKDQCIRVTKYILESDSSVKVASGRYLRTLRSLILEADL